MFFNYKKTFLGCKSTGSCPPYTNEDLPPYFQEISKINQYLSVYPIDFMIDEVEKSSLEHISKGETQLAFSIKEITQYLPYTTYINKERDAFYFLNILYKTTKNIIKQIFESIKKDPQDEKNISSLNTMLGISAEMFLVYEYSKNKDFQLEGVETYFSWINKECDLLKNLKSVYPHFNEIISWNTALVDAKESLNKQLSSEFSFDMRELDTIYSHYEDQGKWMDHMRFLQRDKNIHSNEKLMHMQKVYVKNMKSFALSLKEGVINFLRFSIVCINKEKSRAYSILNSDIMSFYDFKVEDTRNEIERVKSHIKYNKSSYFIKSLEENEGKLHYLLNNKSDFLKNEIKERREFENEIFNSALTQKNINNFINGLKQKILGVSDEIKCDKENKNVIKVEKISNDIIQCKYKDKMIYLISDNATEKVIEIDYACIRFSAFSMNIKDFEKLNEKELGNSNLLRDTVSSMSNVKFTNFNNIPEFINSLKNNHMQSYFLGEENIEVECSYLV